MARSRSISNAERRGDLRRQSGDPLSRDDVEHEQLLACLHKKDALFSHSEASPTRRGRDDRAGNLIEGGHIDVATVSRGHVSALDCGPDLTSIVAAEDSSTWLSGSKQFTEVGLRDRDARQGGLVVSIHDQEPLALARPAARGALALLERAPLLLGAELSVAMTYGLLRDRPGTYALYEGSEADGPAGSHPRPASRDQTAWLEWLSTRTTPKIRLRYVGVSKSLPRRLGTHMAGRSRAAQAMGSVTAFRFVEATSLVTALAIEAAAIATARRRGDCLLNLTP